jgi:hypothetical protein
MRYAHLEIPIRRYFGTHNISVAIEPHGSHDADLVSDCETVVGEIKHGIELRRDLTTKYWNDWNSANTFGGKHSQYRLANDLPDAQNQLNRPALGWAAVIFGQLNHYRRKHGLSEGWVIFENPSSYHSSFMDAVNFLHSIGRVDLISFDEHENVGFARLYFA